MLFSVINQSGSFCSIKPYSPRGPPPRKKTSTSAIDSTPHQHLVHLTKKPLLASWERERDFHCCLFSGYRPSKRLNSPLVFSCCLKSIYDLIKDPRKIYHTAVNKRLYKDLLIYKDAILLALWFHNGWYMIFLHVGLMGNATASLAETSVAWYPW